MQIVKVLRELASLNDCVVVVINFNHHGISKLGYIVVDKDWNEIMTLEPSFSNGPAKWRLKNTRDISGYYITGVNELRKYERIKPGITGRVFKF